MNYGLTIHPILKAIWIIRRLDLTVNILNGTGVHLNVQNQELYQNRNFNNDLTEVNSEKFTYLHLSRPIMEYKSYEDNFVRTAITYLINHDVEVYHYITNDLGLEPGFDYLLLHYLENSDYMDHIMDIRIKNESQ